MISIKTDILSTLAYFDIFYHPLTKKEIWLFLAHACESGAFDKQLEELLHDGAIHAFGGMYSLRNDALIAAKRKEANINAQELMGTAKKVAGLLSRFPFVRAVGVSGSLSKNVANKSSDIDLFIITAPCRLWIARTVMHCFKKITFLFNKQHYFCMNYYVDEATMTIEEKNIYTATEVVTLIPLQGPVTLERFYQENAWSKQFLPNQFMRVSVAQNMKFFLPKYVFEICFDNRLGNWLDDRLMQITAKRWQKKTMGNKKNNRGVTMSMVAKKHVAKPDPVFFQNNLLSQYNKKADQFIRQFEPGYALVK
jgi:hypothetical protein